jgi:capsular polysaccharide transport system permease protein
MNVDTIDHVSLHAPSRQSKTLAWMRRHRWIAMFVGLPTLLATFYYGLIASDIYVSQSRFVVKSPGQKSAQSLTLANLVQTSGLSSGQEQTKEVLDYIRSRNALQDLQKTVNVRARYANADADFMSRFPRPFRNDSFEDLYKYYRTVVSADVDTESGLAVVEVRGFKPKDAHDINAQLLSLSEALINRLNERAESRAIVEAEARVGAAQARLGSARAGLSSFRNQQDIIDPAKQATGVLEISNRLIGEQAALIAQLDLMQRVTPRHPGIPGLRNRIAAIGTQIGAQTNRAVGSPTAIASKLGNYEKLQVEQEFATQMLAASSTALEQARTESQRQQYYVECIVEPNVPDEPTLPSRLKSILIVFGIAVGLYLIGWMLVVGILEHAPED